jgi:hypothetical protein
LEVAAMSPWPAPERDIWRPRPGILQPSDLRRALREHPAWQLHGQRLIRELRFTDFAEAFGFVEQLAGQVQHIIALIPEQYGRGLIGPAERPQPRDAVAGRHRAHDQRGMRPDQIAGVCAELAERDLSHHERSSEVFVAA